MASWFSGTENTNSLLHFRQYQYIIYDGNQKLIISVETWNCGISAPGILHISTIPHRLFFFTENG